MHGVHACMDNVTEEILGGIMIKFTLYGNTPSKKNSKVAIAGRAFPNPAYSKWYTLNFGKQKAEHRQEEWRQIKAQISMLRKPLNIGVFFYRKDVRSFDYDNMITSVQDAMKKSELIEDDDMHNVIPVVFGWGKDNKDPRCEVTVWESEIERRETGYEII